MGESRIRSGHVLLALADDADLKRLLARPVQDAIAVNVETLRENFHAIVAPSVEAREARGLGDATGRSEEHTSELQSLMRTSYAVFCLKKKKNEPHTYTHTRTELPH